MKILIAAGPVIVEDNKILLIKDKEGFLKFCGGKVENFDNNLIESAMREAKEEMGIDVKIINDEPFITFARKNTNEGMIDVILVHFLAERIGEIEPGEDIREWDWFDMNDLPDDLGPNILPALKHFTFI